MGVLLLILVGAAGLRFYQIGRWSLWLDELYSMASSAGHYPDQSPLKYGQVMLPSPHATSLKTARPWYALWRTMRDGTHPPLYILALRGWREIFGEGDAAARALSAVASLLTILLLYDAGKLLHGRTPALWAAALMTVSGVQIYYAQEVRPYAMLVLLAAGGLSAIVRVEKLGANWRRLLALGACALGMALTHYFSFGALCALTFYAAYRLRSSARWRSLGIIVAAGVIFLLSWGPSMWAQRHNTEFSFLADHSPHLLGRTILRADDMPVRFLVEPGYIVKLGFKPGIHGLGLVLYIGVGWLLWRRRGDLLLPYVWLISTALFLGCLDLLRHTSHLAYPRYTLVASPGLYLLMGVIFSEFRPRWAHGFPAAMAAICLAVLPAYYGSAKQDWRSAGAYLREHAGPTEPVVFASGGEPWWASALCMGFSHYAYSPQRPIVVLDRPATSEMLANLAKSRRAWFISESSLSPPTSFLPGCQVEGEAKSYGMAWIWKVTWPTTMRPAE